MEFPVTTYFIPVKQIGLIILSQVAADLYSSISVKYLYTTVSQVKWRNLQ